MAKKSTVQPDYVEKLLNKVKHAEKERDDADEKYGYSRCLKEYRGDYATAMPSFLRDTQLIPINEVFAYTKAFIPSVYSRNPHIAFNAKGAKHIASSKLLEAGVNAYWRELRLKQQIRRCIFDAIFAEGWMKVGFSAVFGSIEPEDGEVPLENNEFIRDEEIFATRISWKHMVRDCDAVDGIHDARWLGQKIIKPYEAIINSPLYTGKDISPTHTTIPEDGSLKRRNQGEDREEFIEFWEIWDMDTEKVYWVSDGCVEYMREPQDWPYKFDGYPFEMLRFNADSDQTYHPNLISPWEPQLWEKIKIRSMQMDHIKRFNRQLWARKGSVTKPEMEKFSRGQTGAVNFYEGDMPPQPAQYPQIQTDIYTIESRIDMDKDNISGQPNAVRSAPQRTQSRTLGEIDRLITSFQSRQNDPQGEVEDFCDEIATKLAAIMQDYLPGAKLVEVTQEDLPAVIAAFGKENWDGVRFKFTREQISGAEFETEVKTGSTLPLDRQGRIDAMISILKLGPSIGISPNSKLSQVIGKNILSEFEMKEIEIAYEEMIAEIERAKVVARAAAQAQNALAQQKIANARSVMAAGRAPNPGNVAAPGMTESDMEPLQLGQGQTFPG